MDIIIKNGGRLRFLNSNVNSARGAASVSSILWDEAGFQPFLASLREASSPCMSMLLDKKREYFVSTPNSKNGLYWELVDSGNPEPVENICKKIVNGEYPPFYWYIDKNGFAKIFVWWKCHPLYGQNPRFLIDKHEKDLIPWSVLNREYNLDFSSEAEGQFFTSISLERCWVDALFEERAEEGAFYCAGLDTNDGGSDYCVLSIWKKIRRKFYLVHTYRANHGTFDKHLEMILISIAKFPNMLLAVEKNSSGNNYYHQIKRRMPDLNAELISTTTSNKPSMVHRIKAVIEARRIFWQSKDSIQEDFESYRQHEDKYEACSGRHDDHISALGVMLENLDRKGLLGGY